MFGQFKLKLLRNGPFTYSKVFHEVSNSFLLLIELSVTVPWNFPKEMGLHLLPLFCDCQDVLIGKHGQTFMFTESVYRKA